MVDGRLDGTLRNYTLNVGYEPDYEIEGSLIAGLEKLGLNAGGSFVQFERTSWRLDVAF